MRILLANYRFYPSGGPEAYLFNVTRLFEEAGHEIVHFSIRSELNEPCAYAGYFPRGKDGKGSGSFNSIEKTPSNAIRMLECAFYNREAYRNLRRLIRDERPDVVYVLQQVNALSPSVFKACKDEGVPVVHRISDFNMVCPRFDLLRDGEVCTECVKGGPSRAMSHSCFHGSRAATLVRVQSMLYHRRRRLFDDVDAYVCPTEFTATVLAEGGVDASRLHVIPTFASIPRANPPARGSRVLYLGRISPEKGLEYLVRAVSEVPGVGLDVTGDAQGPYAEKVMDQAKSLSGRVAFHGFVSGDAKEALFRDALCVVCPSICVENMPNAVLEAYAHGLPAVVFDVGCMREIVKDGETGFVVLLKDTAALSKCIRRLHEDRGLARQLGENGRRFCGERFGPRLHLERLTGLFEEVISKNVQQTRPQTRREP